MDALCCHRWLLQHLELDLLYTQSYILQKLVSTIPVLVPPNLAPCTLVNTTAAAVSMESHEQDG
jgi:hypothetical protein